MILDPASINAEQAYKLLTGIVVPRPIAWVTNISPEGLVNLAPFSTFTFVSPKPLMLGMSIGHKAGVYKDTVLNILKQEEFVIHIADRPHINALHDSAIEYTSEVSEVEQLGLKTVPSDLTEGGWSWLLHA